MAQQIVQSDLLVNGNVSVSPTGSMTIPSGAVGNTQVATPTAGNGIAANKVNHAVEAPYRQNGTGNDAAAIVADAGSSIYSAQVAGTIKGVRAWVTTKATGGDRTVTVDVQKASDGGSFSTILTGTISFDSSGSTSNLTEKAGSLATTTYSAKDKFQVIIAVAGAAGNQAKGLVVILDLWENGT